MKKPTKKQWQKWYSNKKSREIEQEREERIEDN